MKNKSKIIALIKNAKYGTIKIVPKEEFNLDLEKRLIDILKNMQFVETVKYGWVKKFTRVVIDETGVYIGHLFENNFNLKLSIVENPLKTLKEWINYFDNI